MDNRDQVFLSLKAEIDRQAMEKTFAYESMPDLQTVVLGAHALSWTQALAAALGSRDEAVRWIGEQMSVLAGRPAVGKPNLRVVSN